MKRKKTTAKQKLVIKIVGLLLLFIGVVLLGVAYIANAPLLLSLVGVGVMVLGLILIASPDAWFNVIMAVFIS